MAGRFTQKIKYNYAVDYIYHGGIGLGYTRLLGFFASMEWKDILRHI